MSSMQKMKNVLVEYLIGCILRGLCIDQCQLWFALHEMKGTWSHYTSNRHIQQIMLINLYRQQMH